MLYRNQANVRVDFFETKFAPGESVVKKYHRLYGFLTDEGLTLSLTNRFANALDLAQSIFGQLGEFKASLEAVGQGLGLSSQTKSYITTSTGGRSIILNAPYYWQGVDPISFDLSLYQIADTETQITEDYQRILEILSPSMGAETELKTTQPANSEGQPTASAKTVAFFGMGPGIAYVQYFPSPVDVGDGSIKLGPCLCSSVSMEIKPPYSYSDMPIIGSYKFHFQTSRIVDRAAIKTIFGSVIPYKPEKTPTPEPVPVKETAKQQEVPIKGVVNAKGRPHDGMFR